MKFDSLLKALPSVIEVATQLVGSARAAKAASGPPAEEIARIEELATRQAELTRDLATRVEELAAVAALQEERILLLNKRSSVIFAIAVFAASLGISGAVVAIIFAGKVG
ncbi:MAG: hypothetical protein ACKO2G_08165 [Verrucomicrobiales bacterium]